MINMTCHAISVAEQVSRMLDATLALCQTGRMAPAMRLFEMTVAAFADEGEAMTEPNLAKFQAIYEWAMDLAGVSEGVREVQRDLYQARIELLQKEREQAAERYRPRGPRFIVVDTDPAAVSRLAQALGSDLAIAAAGLVRAFGDVRIELEDERA